MMSQSDFNFDPTKGASILQRRRQIRPASPSPRKCIPRCLFGPPDPNMNTAAMIAKVMAEKMGGFCNRWNIDPRTGDPVETQVHTASTIIPEVEAKTVFIWTRISAPTDNIEDADGGMAATVTNLVAQESTQVTSAAPALVVAEVVATQEKSGAVANQIQMMMTGGSARAKVPGPGGKRSCSGGGSSGGAKQRVITDYMKEKRVLPGSMDQDKDDKKALPEMMDQDVDEKVISP